MPESPCQPRHPIDDYLERLGEFDDDSDRQAHRTRMLELIQQLTQHLVDHQIEPLPLSVILDVPNGMILYLYAHGFSQGLEAKLPDHLMPLANKARKHVEGGGEYCIDHALGISEPPFRGARPKKPSEHKHQRLFLMAFHDYEAAETFDTQIDSLRNAARLVGLKGYQEKSLDGEFRAWRDRNHDWLLWLFAMD